MTKLYVIAIAVCALAGSACDEKLSDVAGPTPNLEPTLSSIQREIFSASDSTGRAACAQCHTNIGRNPSVPGFLLLEGQSHQSLVGRASLNKPGAVHVIAGDPDNSYLIQKLEGRAGIAGIRMPRNGPPFLTEGQVSIIRRWIQLGAKND
ncbi:MAG: hypothetical protein ACRD2N_22170 [Vicinamibacterales bacterium]